METQPAESATPAAMRPPESAPSGVDERHLPLTGHLDELRKRLWIGIGALLAASMASFAAAARLVDWLKHPAGSSLERLAFFSPPEAILAYMKVAITAGLFLAMPILLAQLWAFIRPGLSIKERRAGIAFIGWGSALFLLGGAFAYVAVLPVSLRFLLGFGGGQLEPVISINRYLSFTTMVMLACGVMFQLPLAVFLLAKLGLVRPQTLRRRWRHAVLGIVVVGALLTPTTDVATLLLMTVPMLALYELSIWVATWAAPRSRDDA